MTAAEPFELFLVAIPGLEAPLLAEAKAAGFAAARIVAGGVSLMGGWPEVWRANLELRGASRVLARIGSFRASHLSELDKRARRFPWKDVLRVDVPVTIEASCRKSKIYHTGAVVQRIAAALREECGLTVATDADVVVMARIDNNICTLSIDTSGGHLHKRGHKEAIAKAPLRETMAAMFLQQCGFKGTETIIDPMCGSGTFVIEAAEMALGLKPGRARAFAFEKLMTFDAAAWQQMRIQAPAATSHRFVGFDRDAGAIKAAAANAARAGVSHVTQFKQQSISDLIPPDGPPGLVICNPPYGTRIGDKRPLRDLYAAFGCVMLDRFSGWRIGLITSDPSLARGCGLPFESPDASVLHGGLRIRLYRTNRLE